MKLIVASLFAVTLIGCEARTYKTVDKGYGAIEVYQCDSVQTENYLKIYQAGLASITHLSLSGDDQDYERVVSNVDESARKAACTRYYQVFECVETVMDKKCKETVEFVRSKFN